MGSWQFECLQHSKRIDGNKDGHNCMFIRHITDNNKVIHNNNNNNHHILESANPNPNPIGNRGEQY